MRFLIGYRFIRIGRKNKKVEKIVDYHITKNLAGDVVKKRYVTEWEGPFGQKMTDYDVPEATVARGQEYDPMAEKQKKAR